MPVYNEEGTIQQIVPRVLAQPSVAELIAIDDGSTDRSWELLNAMEAEFKPRLVLQQHPRNRGKGASIRTGFALAKFPVILIQDADLEYNPSEYHKLLEPILDGRADVVFGSRFVGGETRRVLYFWHSVGNRFLTLLSNMATNLNLSDMETGFKAFRREIVQQISIEEDRFGFEPEITARLAALGARIYEVGVEYRGRTYKEGKKIDWRDGFSALRCILKYNLFRKSLPEKLNDPGKIRG
jgi:glycosyltransferase involved in cell wall biosynthesis